MTIASTTSRNDYTGNGSVGVYAYGFRILSSADIAVTVRNLSGVETTLTLTTDYTVSNVGELSGGDVTLVNSSQAWLTAGNLTTGYALTIRRVLSLTQATDIRNQGDYFPEDIEDQFDRSIMIAQQQQDTIERSIHLPETVSSAGFSAELPSDIASNVGSAIIVNSTGTGLSLGTANSGTDSSRVAKAGDSMTGTLTMTAGNPIVFQNAASSFGVSVDANDSLAASYEVKWPTALPAFGLPIHMSSTGQMYVSGFTSAKSADYTVLATDNIDTILMTTAGTNRTVTLPAAASSTGRKLCIKKVDSGTGKVIVDGNASETIDGATTKNVMLQYEHMTIQCDGTGWHIIDRKLFSDWVSFTPSTTHIANVTPTGQWRRVGSSMEIQMKMAYTGTTTAAQLVLTLPNSYTTSVIGNYTAFPLGHVVAVDLGGSTYFGDVRYFTSTTLSFFTKQASGVDIIGANLTNAAPFTFNVNDVVAANIMVPITEFAL